MGYTFTQQAVSKIAETCRWVKAQPRSTQTSNPINVTPGARFSAKITNVSGSFPIWTYTIQRVTSYSSSTATWLTDGINLTAFNTCETNVTSGTFGNGITITSASGQANSGSCVIQSIGVNAVVDVCAHAKENGLPVFRFCVSNSAQ